MLYDLTFAQLLSLIETKNSRDYRANQEAERRAGQERDPHYAPPPRNIPEEASQNDVMRAFGMMA